jgi:hypothetical protein
MRAYCSFEATNVGIAKRLRYDTRGSKEKSRTLEVSFSNQRDFRLGNIFGIFVYLFVIYGHFVRISYAVQVRDERLSSNNVGRIASIRSACMIRVVDGKLAANNPVIVKDEVKWGRGALFGQIYVDPESMA